MDDLLLQCLGSSYFPTRMPPVPTPECQEVSFTRDCFMTWSQSKGKGEHHKDFTQTKGRCGETSPSVEKISITSQEWTNPESQGLSHLDIPRYPVPTLDLAPMQTSSTKPILFPDLLIPSGVWTECLCLLKFICWNPNPGCDGTRGWGLWGMIRSWRWYAQEWD